MSSAQPPPSSSYSTSIQVILVAMILTGAARTICVKVYYQWGLDDPLFVTILFVAGHALALPLYYWQQWYYNNETKNTSRKNNDKRGKNSASNNKPEQDGDNRQHHHPALRTPTIPTVSSVSQRPSSEVTTSEKKNHRANSSALSSSKNNNNNNTTKHVSFRNYEEESNKESFIGNYTKTAKNNNNYMNHSQHTQRTLLRHQSSLTTVPRRGDGGASVGSDENENKRSCPPEASRAIITTTTITQQHKRLPPAPVLLLPKTKKLSVLEQGRLKQKLARLEHQRPSLVRNRFDFLLPAEWQHLTTAEITSQAKAALAQVRQARKSNQRRRVILWQHHHHLDQIDNNDECSKSTIRSAPAPATVESTDVESAFARDTIESIDHDDDDETEDQYTMLSTDDSRAHHHAFDSGKTLYSNDSTIIDQPFTLKQSAAGDLMEMSRLATHRSTGRSTSTTGSSSLLPPIPTNPARPSPLLTQAVTIPSQLVATLSRRETEMSTRHSHGLMVDVETPSVSSASASASAATVQSTQVPFQTSLTAVSTRRKSQQPCEASIVSDAQSYMGESTTSTLSVPLFTLKDEVGECHVTPIYYGNGGNNQALPVPPTDRTPSVNSFTPLFSLSENNNQASEPSVPPSLCDSENDSAAKLSSSNSALSPLFSLKAVVNSATSPPANRLNPMFDIAPTDLASATTCTSGGSVNGGIRDASANLRIREELMKQQDRELAEREQKMLFILDHVEIGGEDRDSSTLPHGNLRHNRADGDARTRESADLSTLPSLAMGSRTGLPREARRSTRWVSKIPYLVRPLIPSVLNLFNTICRLCALLYLDASVAEFLIAGFELVFSVLAARFLRGRAIPEQRWFGVAVVLAALVQIWAVDLLSSKEEAGLSASSDEQMEDKSGNDSLLGIFFVLGKVIFAVFQDLSEEVFMQETRFPVLQLLGLEGLYAFVIAVPFYFALGPLVGNDPMDAIRNAGESPKTVCMTFALLGIFCAAGIFQILSTGVTSSMTRNMWKNFRGLIVLLIGLFLYHASDEVIGEEFAMPVTLLNLGAFGVILAGLVVYYVPTPPTDQQSSNFSVQS